MREEYAVYEKKMGKSISVMEGEFAAIRAGRANPAVLDKVTVDYYGVPTPVAQMAEMCIRDRLKEVLLEGGKRTTEADFLRGHPVKAGDRFAG